MTNNIVISNNQILFYDIPIHFFRKNPGITDRYFTTQEIIVKKTDCGWEFEVPFQKQSDQEIIGIMIPTHSFEIIVGNNPVDIYKSQKYYYAPNKELQRILKINPLDINIIDFPIVHMQNNQKVISWSSPNECLISTFVYQYQWYVNIEAITNKNIFFFADQSTNYIINFQRYPIKKREILINNTTSLKTMQNALLTGAKPRLHPNYSHDIIKETRQIQLNLKKQNINSIIIGSLARRLNSISVDVNDIDLMVKDKKQLQQAIQLIESFADRIYLHDNYAKFQYKKFTIDICYDNYNVLSDYHHIITKHGLSYLGSEGLLWLYMIELFSCDIDEHSMDYKDRTHNAIVSLLKSHQFDEFDIIPYKKNLPDYSQNCFKFCEILSESEVEYRDIRINKPFLVRPFKKENKFIYVIINLGSCCDAELVIDQAIGKATWEDISGHKSTIVATSYDNFSVIHISQISLPGIIQCQKSQ